MALMPGAESLALSAKSDTDSVLGSIAAVTGIMVYLTCEGTSITTACQYCTMGQEEMSRLKAHDK